MLDDDDLDAVFVVTRHSSHAELTARALRAGKAVFVEKPLALTEDELAGSCSTRSRRPATTGCRSASTAGSRRCWRRPKKRFGGRIGPASVRYLVNAGPLDRGSWYLAPGTEGSRFAGEGGHFIDTVSWLLGADPTGVRGRHARQADLQVMLRYPDGSTATISYVTTGHRLPEGDARPRRRRPQCCGSTTSSGACGRKTGRKRPPRPEARQGPARRAGRVPRGRPPGGPMPVPLDSLVATTRATLAVQTEPRQRRAGADRASGKRSPLGVGTSGGSAGWGSAELLGAAEVAGGVRWPYQLVEPEQDRRGRR